MRFKLADDRMFSVDFNVVTVKNMALTQSETLIKKRTTHQAVYFRDIALDTGEEYSFVENLKDYIDLTEPAVYYADINQNMPSSIQTGSRLKCVRLHRQPLL